MPANNGPKPPPHSRPGPPTPIHELQGIGHLSPFTGRRVSTTGIVTGIERRGFYLQDPRGDDDIRTSDALFVFTKEPPVVTVGDRVEVEGTVEEFRRHDADLSSTQLARSPKVTVIESNVDLPAPVELGSPNRPWPSGSLYEAGLRYESLEGMRVRLPSCSVIGATNRHGDVYVAPDGPGTGLDLSPDGVLRGHPERDYPARIKLTFDRKLYGGRGPQVDVGDRLGPLEGIFFHAYGFFGVKPTRRVKKTAQDRKPAVTRLVGTEWGLTFATFNVENLDPVAESPERSPEGGRPDDDLGSGKVAAIARQIADHLLGPDIIAVQEIQDNDGIEDSGNTDASKTWTTLINAIVEVGGPRYDWVDRAPEDGADGGQPGGNIRVGYLYKPDRVRLLDDAVVRVGDGDPAFIDGRKSLAAAFEFKPTTAILHTIVNHWASKRGSSPTYRDPNLPEVIGNAQERLAQQAVIEAHVRRLIEKDPAARVLSVGDFNAPEYSPELMKHGSGALFNLGEKTPNDVRYSYIREGLAEPIDHQFASRVLEGKAEFEYVHVNSVFADKASDHDPSISRIDMRD